VALLASVRLSPQEIQRITVTEISFTAFLDDGGEALEQLKQLGTEIGGGVLIRTNSDTRSM